MKNSQKAFTLIELLTVIAIIGILAGIIIPTVGAVKTSANKAKSKVQFSQWAASAELFKQDYGFYPTLASAAGSGLVDTSKFAGALTGRDVTGSRATGAALNGNKKGASFYSISDSELAGTTPAAAVLIDAFRNQQIMVLIDADNDGFIKGGELTRQTLSIGNSQEDGISASGVEAPSSDYFPATGIRAGVAFYSPGKEGKSGDYIYTWSVK